MARPQSSVRVALSAELIDGSGTCRELWRRMGCEWPLYEVRIALRNMVTAGEVDNLEVIRQAGVRRPVPVYRRRIDDDLERDDQVDGAGIHDLIACWAGLAAPQRMGAAM